MGWECVDGYGLGVIGQEDGTGGEGKEVDLLRSLGWELETGIAGMKMHILGDKVW